MHDQRILDQIINDEDTESRSCQCHVICHTLARSQALAMLAEEMSQPV